MLRVFYVSTCTFALCFLVIGVWETWTVNHMQEKTIKKFEFRYDCELVVVPTYKKVLKSAADIFGLKYETFNKERDCIRYKYEYEVPNPEYEKYFMPNFPKIITISILSTIGVLLYMSLFGYDWISQHGDYELAAAGFRKVHVKKDKANAYRAAAYVLFGDENRFEELIPSTGAWTEPCMALYHGNPRNSRAFQCGEPHSFQKRMEVNFILHREIMEKYKIPIEIYKDSLVPVFVLSYPGYEHLEPVRINEEPTGFYSAIIPSNYTRITRNIFEWVFYPFHVIFGFPRRQH